MTTHDRIPATDAAAHVLTLTAAGYSHSHIADMAGNTSPATIGKLRSGKVRSCNPRLIEALADLVAQCEAGTLPSPRQRRSGSHDVAPQRAQSAIANPATCEADTTPQRAIMTLRERLMAKRADEQRGRAA